MDIDIFEKSMHFKHGIIYHFDNPDKMIDNYKELFSEPFNAIAEEFAATIESDPSFILLSKRITDNILDIVSTIRADKDNYDDFNNDLANDIIRYINLNSRHITYDERNKIVKRYLKEEGKNRNKRYKHLEEMIIDIIYDSPVYFSIISPEVKENFIEYLEDGEYKELVLNHSIFFLNKCPSLCEDELFKNKIKEIVESENYESLRDKKRAKTLKKQMNILKK